MGDLGAIGKLMMMAWSTLADAVKKGGSVVPPPSQQDAAAFFSRLVPAIFAFNFLSAKAAVAELGPAGRRPIKDILDVAAGAAPWSIPFASAIKNARVTAVDFPAVTAVTRQFAEKWKVADKFDYWEGDFNELDFGSDRFDLVILGHIIHGQGAAGARKLIDRAYRALRDRGLLLIGEFVPNDERSAPEVPLLFGLNMFLNTPHGDVYTMREYREWLREAGFRKVSTMRAPAISPLILATR